MNIGELFVSLGVKGGKETQNTLKGVKTGMKDVKSMSLEAKAAIVAAVYALKSLVSQSNQQGAALTQFANLTGLSTKKLQQWQYANKLAGGTAEEVTGMITGMQQAFAQLELGEGPAKYLGLFAEGLQKVGESLDVEKMNDSFYTLEKFKKFLQGGGTGKIGIDNEIGASLGISPGVIAGIRGGLFDDKILNKADVYSEKQAKSLQNIGAQWTALADHIQKTIGRLNVEFGSDLIKNIRAIVNELANVIVELAKFAKEVELFDRLLTVLENIANIISWITGVSRMLNEKGTPQQEAAKKARSEESTTSQFFGGLKALYGDVLMGTIADIFKDGVNPDAPSKRHFVPNVTPGSVGGSGGGGTTIVQQTINVGQGANVSQVKEGARSGATQGVQSAYRQLSAQGL